MSELIKDFTPFFTKENMKNQRVNIKDDIANLLTLLNTHQLMVEGGADLYVEKDAYEQIDLKDVVGYDILDNKALGRFMSKTISSMAEEAYEKGDVIFALAKKLLEFDPNDQASIDALGKAWLENADMIQNLLYLYSEYIYKVFMDNPYISQPIGLKRERSQYDLQE